MEKSDKGWTRDIGRRITYAGRPVEEEVGPEAVLLPETTDSALFTATPTRSRHTESRWHLLHAERAFTWCGVDIGYGHPRRRWSDTDEERRCQLCIGRLRGAPAFG